MKTINLNGRTIGEGCPPYVVAEISANHNGSLERALQLLETAVECGADAVKLQTYRPDTITINSNAEEFQIHKGLWAGKNLYELYEWAQMPWEWHEPLFARGRELGITVFSSPFDYSAVDFLEKLNAPAYKIASFEIVDLPLIRYVVATGKPLIISTGASTEEEIQEAVTAACDAGCRELVLLHCVSSYPASATDYNIRTIPDMKQRFKIPAGLSDHTLDNATAVAATALGACMIEKHFTLSRNDGGPDDSFSLEPGDLKALCRDVKTAWGALGEANYGLQPSEENAVNFRRSLYVVKDMKAGDVFTEENVRSIRPGYGLPPKYLNEVIGKTAAHSIPHGTPVDKSMIQKFEGHS